MTGASTPPAELLQLPKGGGALHGMGETFAPDLHTGTGNFAIPLGMPAGRNGFGPDLTLRYSTGQGNGPLGLGWGLGLPFVARRTAHGIPRYTADDVCCLAGDEELVPVDKPAGPTPVGQHFRPRIDSAAVDVVRHTGPDDNWWEIRTKNGHVQTFGTPGHAVGDPAALRDPRAPDHVFSWVLTRTVDSFGNVVEYSWRRKDGPGGTSTQLLLDEVRYVDHRAADGSTRFLVTIGFTYSNRPDPVWDRRPGFTVRTDQRCTAITAYTHTDVTRPVRAIRLGYDSARAVSLLSEVTPVGYDDDGVESQEMPAVRLGYTGFDPARRRFSKVEGAPLVGLADPALELVDVFGTALPDVVEIGGSVRYWRNRGGCLFDAPRPMPDAPGGISLSDPGVTLLDANGNGRADVMVSRPSLFGYFPLRFDGGWDRSSFRPLTSAPPFSFTDPDVRLVDLDGDGITDVVRTSESVELWFGTPGRGWTRGSAYGGVSSSFPSVSLADPRVRFADMTGDGLQDLVVLMERSVAYWPSLGYGRFDSRVVMKHAPNIPVGFDPKRLLLGDVSGDGSADLVYVDNGQVSLWLNEAGTSWSEAITVPGTPRVSANMDLRLTDLTGSGVSGVLWSGSAAPGGAAQWWFLDFTGGTKPDLLNRVDNQLGAVTEVSYASSTSMSLIDQAKPATRWRTPLPFPVQVVAKITSVDALSGGVLSRAFHYRHGYWDGVEREFCGFGTVEEYDSESFEEHTARDRGKAEPVRRTVFSPPTLTRTFFHQGPMGDGGDRSEFDARPGFWPGDAHLLDHKAGVDRFLARIPPSPERGRVVRDALRSLRGSVLRSELYELDGSALMARPHSVEERSYGLREFMAPAGTPDPPGRRPVFRSQPTAQRTTQWERGDDPLTRFVFYDEYDDFGQAGQVTQVAAPRRSRCRHPVTGAVVGTVEPDEIHFLASHSRTRRATPEAGVRIHDRVAESWLYGLPQSPAAAESAPDDVATVLRDQARAARAIHARFHAADPAALTVLGHTVNYYDGRAFTGLPVGRAGTRGALVRSEELIATDTEFDAAFGELRPQSLDGPVPPLAGPPAALMARHGYRRTTLFDGRRGYYADTQCRRYDFQGVGAGHGLVLASRDPLGAERTIEFDRYGLLPLRLTDAVGLTTQVTPDYRVLRPATVIDPNGNERSYRFSPTGLLQEVWNRGHPSQDEGDRIRPSERYSTDLRAFERRREPIFTHTVRQVRFDTDTTAPPEEHDEVIETREYSDGFGRLIQKRATAEHEAISTEGDGLGLPGTAGSPTSDARWDIHPDRVVITGRQVYDNKGREVRVYDPCFDDGWDYSPSTGAGRPVDEIATEQFYDSRGHVVRVRRPDGSETRVIYGIPPQLSRPDAYDPTPWESYTYDANDLAPLSTSPGDAGPLTGTAPAAHYFTPHSMLIDAHGRSICLIRRAGPEASGQLITRMSYDRRDNLLSVTDPSGTVTFAYAYDLANRRLRVMSPDSGLRTTVLNAVGLPLEQRDAMGGALVMDYDPAGRTSQVWARDDAAQQATLRERVEYGDAGTAAQPPEERAAMAALNLLGRARRHYDGAGRTEFLACDLDGNVVRKERRTIRDDTLLAGWVPDWNGPESDAVLDARAYGTDLRFDALNRVRELRYPEDAAGHRGVLTPAYNAGGDLEAADLDGIVIVDRIAYDAKGRRILIAYGNDLMTRQCYDRRSGHLLRLHTQGFVSGNGPALNPSGAVVQDVGYGYDTVGNITELDEHTPGSGISGSADGADRLRRVFDYDPLYRLVAASGRETDAGSGSAPWDEGPHGIDLTRPCRYQESYQYDAAGNIGTLAHTSFGTDGTPRTTNRHFEYATGSNRLASVAGGALAASYVHDARGNMTREVTSRHFDWDVDNRLSRFRVQPDGGPASVEAFYLYDAAGQRVKKLVRRGSDIETTVYVDQIFEHHHRAGVENCVMHVMDGDERVAELRKGPAFPDDGAADAPVRYHLGDHLGNSGIVVGGADPGASSFIRREEYKPYGGTSFGSYGRKRYRFAGCERDAESGLCVIGARNYAPWLGRWSSTDPIGIAGGMNPYAAFDNNPVRYSDPTGLAPGHGPKQAAGSEAHRDILPRLARRLADRGYDVGVEVKTLPGGSRRANGRGSIDLVISNTEGGQVVGHVYDLKPRGSKGSYDWQLRRYTQKGKMLLKANQPTKYTLGTILDPVQHDPKIFEDIEVSKGNGRVRIYSIGLAVDKNGRIKPGYIDYTVRDEFREQPLVEPVTAESRKKDQSKQKQEDPAVSPHPDPVPVPARTAPEDASSSVAERPAHQTVANRPERPSPEESPSLRDWAATHKPDPAVLYFGAGVATLMAAPYVLGWAALAL